MMCSLSFGLPVIILGFIPNKTPADTEMGVLGPGRVANTRYGEGGMARILPPGYILVRHPLTH